MEGRKGAGRRKEGRKETDQGREKRNVSSNLQVLFTLILLAGMMKARCQCYRNKCQDQMSRDKYKRILEQAICQTVFGVHGRHKEIKEKVGH